jgi:hypothetical protein
MVSDNMRTIACFLVLGVVLLSSVAGCRASGGPDDSAESGGADIKQADCAAEIDVTFGVPKMDSDDEIKKAADDDGVTFKDLATPLATARALEAIDAKGTFTTAAAGACNYKLTAKSDGSAIEGSLHTIGTNGHFSMRYEVGHVLYNATVDAVTKTSIKLHGSSATVMVNDGGTEFHGEPDPSVKAGTVDVHASIPE